MTMITPSYLGETIEYSSLHACRSTLEDPTLAVIRNQAFLFMRLFPTSRSFLPHNATRFAMLQGHQHSFHRLPFSKTS